MDTLRAWYNQVSQAMDVKLLNLLTALAVLVLGYIVAVFISVIVKSVLKRLKLNERLKGVLAGADAESGIGTIVFYLLLAFVLVAFFQKLSLDKATEPLSNLLNSVFLFVPKLIAAGIIALIAWCVAKIAAAVVKKALEAAKVDEWLNAKAGAEEPAAKPGISATIAGCIYGVVILLFLPTILETLGMTDAMKPFNNLIEKIVGFLPNLLSAGVILFVGFFAGKFVKQIVTGLLSAAGADSLAARIGLGKAMGATKLSALLGTVVYILILLPFVVASLGALNMPEVSKPASDLLSTILTKLPQIFGACLVLGVAYVGGALVAGLVTNLLQSAGFDNILVALGLQKQTSPDARKPSYIAGTVITVAIVMYAAVEAAHVLNFNTIADQLSELIVFFGHILMGLIVMGVGLFLSNYAAELVRESDSAGAEQFATGVRIGVIVLFAGMALRQMNIANDIINIGYASILGGVGLAFAIGVGLSFGLGAKETAGSMARQWHSAAKKEPSDKAA